jgi:solute carrier family 25 phosphate transporter 23/24/25/41
MRGNSKRDLAVWERFVAGSLAGALAQTTIYPLDVLKTRLALATTGQYRGALDCAVHACKSQGLRALYRGYLPNVLGILPYAGIDLTIYEVNYELVSLTELIIFVQLLNTYYSTIHFMCLVCVQSLKGVYLSQTGEVKVSVPVLLVCGTVSSTCGQLVSYPLMLVRTKLQAGGA